MKQHLIIGNGVAAFNAVTAIRRLQPSDNITLVSQESCPAYSPVLTPYYIAGGIPYSAMFLCTSRFYRERRVNTFLGRGVVALEPQNQRAQLDSGQTLNYDELLIATGSHPVVPSIPGAGHGLTLWTVGEARRLKAAIRHAATVAVVGAGLIGLQVVEALLRLGKGVSLIEMQDRVLPRVLDGIASQMVAERLLSRGVKLYLGQQVTEVFKKRGTKVLSLASGDGVEAGAVVFATGVLPNMAFLAGTGIKLDRGVVVDESGQANMEHVLAAGDVAQSIDPVSGRPEVNATWTNAVESGWVAGLNMAGAKACRHRRSRVNALSPADLPIVSLGQVEPETDQDEVAMNRGQGYYRKLVFRGPRLIGALLVGEIEEAGILSNAIDSDGLLSPLKGEMARSSAFHCLARSLKLYGGGSYGIAQL